MMSLQSQVDALKDGDYVRAVFEGEHGVMTYEGYPIFGDEKNISIMLPTGQVFIRTYGGQIITHLLTSIEPITPPIPDEPEVGTSVLCEDGYVGQLKKDSFGNIYWHKLDSGDYISRISWSKIYPLIKVLYSPTGEVVWKK